MVPVTLTQARRTPGLGGKVVEWAGTVQGMGATSDGLFMFLTVPGGSIPVRISQTQSVRLGTAVYVLARVAEQSGLIHHLEPIAIAPCREVASAYQQAQAERAAAQVRQRSAHADREREALKALRKSALLRMDARTLAARAPGALSLNGAMQWIHSFNRHLDGGSTNGIARVVLYCVRAEVRGRPSRIYTPVHPGHQSIPASRMHGVRGSPSRRPYPHANAICTPVPQTFLTRR